MKVFGGILVLIVGVLIGILSTELYAQTVQYPAGSGLERSSPGDHIAESQIQLFDDGIYISVQNPTWARFADSNSMDPILDRGTNAIQIVPQDEQDIDIGDIVSYKKGDLVVIHRVIERGIDSQGVYFITKGDNNLQPDPEKVRFEDITRLTVALVY